MTMSDQSHLEFVEFPKIPRMRREMIVTEKIDGTNAQVIVGLNGEVLAASRSRLITPTDDNFGFAAWVHDHAEELATLGQGRHYGEWWGSGIQRGYGLRERRFSLFNVARWRDERPACCHVVPVLHQGVFSTEDVEFSLSKLRALGSFASPGFMKPEGVIVFHTRANFGFKVTLERDEEPKSVAKGLRK